MFGNMSNDWMYGMGSMTWNKKGRKVDSNSLAWAKGRCHLLRPLSLEEKKVWGSMLRVCFTYIELGLWDIQGAGQVGSCIYRAGLQSGLEIYIWSPSICMKFTALDEVIHLVTIARNENGSNRKRKIQEKKEMK